MSLPYVCAQCRHRLSNSARTSRIVHWQSRSSFISLAPQTTKRFPPRDDLLVIVAENKDRLPLRSRSTRRVEGSTQRASQPDNGHLLESLFEDALQPNHASNPVSSATADIARLDAYTHLETLKELVDKPSVPIGEVWQFFVTYLGPESPSSGEYLRRSRPSSFAVVLSKLLYRLVLERRAGVQTPTVTEIVTAYAAMEKLHPKYWLALVDTLLPEPKNEAGQEESTATEGIVGAQEAGAAQAIKDDLLGAWRVLFVTNLPTSKCSADLLSSDSNDWSFFRVDDINIIPGRRSYDFKNLLKTSFLPRCSGVILKNIASRAVWTFDLLSSTTDPSNPALNIHPLVIAIAKMLSASGAHESNHPGMSMREAGGIAAERRPVIARAHEIARHSLNDSSSVELPKIHARRASGDSAARIHQKLSDAQATRNISQVNQLWSVVQHLEPESSSQPSTDAVQLSYGLCNHFIVAYMALRHPNSAVEVWNHMIKLSMTPRIDTWTSMLEGCKLAKDANSLEAIWRKLLLSALKPDKICWTAYIGGLVECGLPDKAMHALEEMGRIWIQATKKKHTKLDITLLGDVDGTVKPAIEIVNAIISGLFRRRLDEAAHQVLEWSGNMGIQPDIFTYNILLRRLVREGRSKDVQELLQSMQLSGVQPDVATFTTILEETFRDTDALTQEQQLETVKMIFTEMKAAGVKPNQYTYGKIIYSLLQSSSGGMKVVEYVLSGMVSQGILPSPHICTNIVENYFQQQQPDLEAIRDFIERVRLSGVSLDHIFWDRVIEGYARIGDTSNALRILGREDRDGKRVGWPAMETVIIALTQNDEWDLARQVVRNARLDRGGPPAFHEKGIEGQHQFWRTASELEIMGD